MQFSGNELQIDLQGRFMQTSMTKIVTWFIKVFKIVIIYLGKVQQNVIYHTPNGFTNINRHKVKTEISFPEIAQLK